MRLALFGLLIGVMFVANWIPAAAAETLSGKMTWWENAVGAWDCTLQLYAVGDQPGGIGPAREVLTIASDNTVHQYLKAYQNEGDSYIGYSDSAQMWWETDIDNAGYAELSTSRDDVTFTQASDATSNVYRDRDVDRVTYTLHNKILSETQELRTKNSWVRSSKLSCRKAS